VSRVSSRRLLVSCSQGRTMIDGNHRKHRSYLVVCLVEYATVGFALVDCFLLSFVCRFLSLRFFVCFLVRCRQPLLFPAFFSISLSVFLARFFSRFFHTLLFVSLFFFLSF